MRTDTNSLGQRHTLPETAAVGYVKVAAKDSAINVSTELDTNFQKCLASESMTLVDAIAGVVHNTKDTVSQVEPRSVPSTSLTIEEASTSLASTSLTMEAGTGTLQYNQRIAG